MRRQREGLSGGSRGSLAPQRSRPEHRSVGVVHVPGGGLPEGCAEVRRTPRLVGRERPGERLERGPLRGPACGAPVWTSPRVVLRT